MTDREKVIKGLEIHLKPNSRCAGCPYPNNGLCGDQLYRDALALLKAQEPRVMTLGEVKSFHGILVWLELSFGAGHETVVVPIEITGVGTGGISFHFGNEDFRTYGCPVYGWRYWTSCPTDEQRKMTPWETGTANGEK